nr:hypothetical protein [uncultured Marinifilum sp.]
MIKIMQVLIIIFFGYSFSQSSFDEKILHATEMNHTINVDSVELMNNELLPELKGNWVSTILTDSIFDKKQISSWKHVFYGDLFLAINESDTLIVGGHMDLGEILFYSEDEKTFVAISDWGETKYSYSRDLAAIFIGDKPNSRIFKKSNGQLMSIIKDENDLMDYVIKRLFTGDYLPKEMISRIKYISLGLETYTPFSFDAIGIENESGKIEYFGWKFIENTLELYKTTSTFDDDSGFATYKIGELDSKYTKNY